jgi:hypothetical protein
MKSLLDISYSVKTAAELGKAAASLSSLVSNAGNSLKNIVKHPRTKHTLIGAGLGGLAGGAADWLDEERDNPDSLWDGITSGAVAGGAAGYMLSPSISQSDTKPRHKQPEYIPRGPELSASELSRRQLDPTLRKSVTPSTPDSEQKSLADVLPEGYREKAQERAKAYRKEQGSDLFEPDVDWTQDLRDEAIDRKVRLEYFKGDSGDPNVDAMYRPPQKNNNGRDSIRLGTRADDTTLGHELTHGTQRFDTSMFGRDGRKPGQSHSVLIDELIESDPFIPNNRDYGRYLSDPHEEEAYLSTIKRDYFRETGKHITNQREAEEALNWMRSKPEVKGETVPLFEGLLRGRGIPDTDRRKAARSLWIKELIKRMPGLVSNNQSNHGKTAYDTSTFEGVTRLQIQNLARQAVIRQRAH